MSADLTGVWDGQYTYPDGIGAAFFTATIIEIGRAVTGTTHEQESW